MELAIQKYLKQYGLELAIEKFKLHCKDLGHKIILKYDQLDSPFSYQEVCECRGLVLVKNTWEVLSYPFYKFYQHTETKAAKIDWESAINMEKRDGSLIQVYYDYIINEWCINTMFSECEDKLINSEETFKSLFLELMNYKCSYFDYFNKEYIYVFELTSPLNKVVVDYKFKQLDLLTVRNQKTLLEYSFNEVCKIGDSINIYAVKTYPEYKSLEDLLGSFNGKGINFEGYVVCDRYFNRIKVKNPSYLCIHLTKNREGKLNLKDKHRFLDIVKYNEISEFCSTFPESLELVNDLHIRYNNTLNKLLEISKEVIYPKNITKEEQKKFATHIFDLLNKYNINKSFSSIFFSMKEGKQLDIKKYLQNYDNSKLINLI